MKYIAEGDRGKKVYSSMQENGKGHYVRPTYLHSHPFTLVYLKKFKMLNCHLS